MVIGEERILLHKQWAFLSPESSVQSLDLSTTKEKNMHASKAYKYLIIHSAKAFKCSSFQVQRIHEIDSLLVVNVLYSSIPVTITSLHDWNFNIWRLFCDEVYFCKRLFVCFYFIQDDSLKFLSKDYDYNFFVLVLAVVANQLSNDFVVTSLMTN